MSHGFHDLFAEKAFLTKPFLYPFLLYLLDNNEILIQLSHFFFFGVAYFAFSLLAQQIFQEVKFLIWSQWMFALSTAIIMVHVFVWTEPMFIFLLMLYWYMACQVWIENKGANWILIIVLACLLVNLRHVSIFLNIITGVLLISTTIRNNSDWKTKFGSVVHLLVPIGLFSFWQWNVYLENQSLERLDHFSQLDFLGNMMIFSGAFTSWFIPIVFDRYGVFSLLFASSLFLGLCFTFKSYLLKDKLYFIYTLAFGMLIIYLLVLLTKGDLIYSDDERYLSVIYPFVLILYTKSIELLSEKFEKIKPYLIWLGGAFLAYQLIRVLKNVLFWSELT